MADYTTVSIPKSLMVAVDKYIDDHPELGIRNRSEAVLMAVRKLVFEK